MKERRRLLEGKKAFLFFRTGSGCGISLSGNPAGQRSGAYRLGNLWDGRVELEAQGEEALIWDLVTALHKQPYIQIEDMETEERPLKEERGFRMAN